MRERHAPTACGVTFLRKETDKAALSMAVSLCSTVAVASLKQFSTYKRGQEREKTRPIQQYNGPRLKLYQSKPYTFTMYPDVLIRPNNSCYGCRAILTTSSWFLMKSALFSNLSRRCCLALLEVRLAWRAVSTSLSSGADTFAVSPSM